MCAGQVLRPPRDLIGESNFKDIFVIVIAFYLLSLQLSHFYSLVLRYHISKSVGAHTVFVTHASWYELLIRFLTVTLITCIRILLPRVVAQLSIWRLIRRYALLLYKIFFHVKAFFVKRYHWWLLLLLILLCSSDVFVCFLVLLVTSIIDQKHWLINWYVYLLYHDDPIVICISLYTFCFLRWACRLIIWLVSSSFRLMLGLLILLVKLIVCTHKLLRQHCFDRVLRC